MSWDEYTKALLKECPQDFVTYLMPGAQYICAREGQFQTSESSFKKREIRSDTMIEAAYNSQPFLMNIEFQVKKDEKMDERLLGYSYEGTRLHNLDVLSCVIYLRKVSKAPQPPLDRILPDDSRSILFNYRSIELAGKPVDELRQHNLDALHPLMLLCKDGATYDVLEEVLTRLKDKGRRELLAATRFFAGIVFKSENDKARLERRFAMITDEDMWKYSWTYRATVEKGIAQGLEQGLLAMRRSIEALVQARFPALLNLTKSRIEPITDLTRLEQISLTVITARTVKEVRSFLHTLK